MNEKVLETLPLESTKQSFQIDEQFVSELQELTRLKNGTPLTTGAVALKGAFEILNKLEIDWRSLLHVSQSFEYKNHFEGSTRLSTVSRLVKHRKKAGRHWLFFETEIIDETRGEVYGLAKSQIMLGPES